MLKLKWLDDYFIENSSRENVLFMNMYVKGWEFNDLKEINSILSNKGITIILEFIWKEVSLDNYGKDSSYLGSGKCCMCYCKISTQIRHCQL